MGVDKVMVKDRVGLSEAKRIFQRRSLQSQVHDRRQTSKNLVFPYSKNSYKWKQDPSKYDMMMVDTKHRRPRVIIRGKLYTHWEVARDLKQAERQKKEILGSFSTKTVIPLGMKMKEIEKTSSVNVAYKKNNNRYDLFIHPKKNMFPVFHPIIVQKNHRRQRR